jgi:hypothetical protein
MAGESTALEYKELHIFALEHSIFEEISYWKVPLEWLSLYHLGMTKFVP